MYLSLKASLCTRLISSSGVSLGKNKFSDCAWQMYFCLALARRTNTSWFISKLVLNTAFSSSVSQSTNCTDPLSLIIWLIVSSLYTSLDFIRSTRTGFILLISPAGLPCTKTFLYTGSMPWETLPQTSALELLGAIASKCVLRTPWPLHHLGSPLALANHWLASLACFWIILNIFWFRLCASNDSMSIMFCCK